MIADQEGKICRYFNTLGGCWYGQQCKFLHIPNQKPPCKFFYSASGCRFGDACHFSHDRLPLKAVENNNAESEEPAAVVAAAAAAAAAAATADETTAATAAETTAETTAATTTSPDCRTGTNNNSMFLAQNLEPEAAGSGVDNGAIYCTTCRTALQRQGSESYYNLLRDHYLESFFEKDADHIRNVRIRAAMEFGALYSCKVCNLVFEKPWSLFQHCTDKARAVKASRLEKKPHSEWLDEVAGAMAAYDLGLFPPEQVRDSLRENLATPAVEEEIESATNAFNMCVLLNCMLNNLTPPPAPQPQQQQQQQPQQQRRVRSGSRNQSGRRSAPPAAADEKRPDPASGDVNQGEAAEAGACGFTKEEVDELLSQNIKPWDPEAATALAAIRGEFDHLLSSND